VGDSRSITVDVRIISTSNRELREEVAKGNFREDLYHRLSIVPITIPPLRERASDIPLLVHHFLRNIPDESKRVRIDPEVIERLKTYPWSGNVRELVNVIQQMTIFCNGNRITLDDLPLLQPIPKGSADEEGKGKVDLIHIVSDLERKWILRKLNESDWNREKAAALLGMTRKMLNNRIAKYKIKPPSKQRS
jgi:DNA-binding NtrC family response regulator